MKTMSDIKELRKCTGDCKGSGFIGVGSPKDIDISKINSDNLILIPCSKCGGTGFENSTYKPDDSSYDQDNIII